MDKVKNQASIDIVSAFTDALISKLKPVSPLHVRMSNFSIFDMDDKDFIQVHRSDEISPGSKFDFILGDLPLGMYRVDCEFGGKKLRMRYNWSELLNITKSLNKDGTAIFLIEPSGFSTSDGVRLENSLNEEGYSVTAIFNAPEALLKPETSINPIFVAITTEAVDFQFIAELLSEEQSKEVVESYFSKSNERNLKKGMQIPAGSFRSFHRIKIKQQIEKLETQYKSYEEYSIGDLSKEINSAKHGEILQEKDNSIYIPKIGNSPVVSKLSETKLKHHNYFQVVLSGIAINEYVCAFFRSTIGRLILDSLTSRTFIPQLNKKELQQTSVALPKPDEQKAILSTQRKLHTLKSSIDVFDSELALNPTSSNSILKQLDSMLTAISGLNIVDRIRGIIREGESKRAEFKESLSLDLRKYTKEKYLELSALKTVAAFLNTEGGVLLIGVSDDGNISGLNTEIEKFHKNVDKFLLHWKNLIKVRIGEGFYPFIEYRIVEVGGKNILLVECKKSPSPCYLDNSEFYVRTNPSTDKLEGPKLVEYVKNHFKS